MSRILIILIISCIILSSCFLFKRFEQTTFSYTDNNQTYSVPIIVPKGYRKATNTVDERGNISRTYEYEGNTILYIAYLKDTAKELQPIQKEINQPHVHPLGGLIYKGVDLDLLFWREIRRKNFRFGYRNVPSSWEFQFDSATNYMSLQKLNK